MAAKRRTDQHAAAAESPDGPSAGKSGPDGRAEADALSWLTEGPAETRRTTTRSFRLSPSECDRIDGAAEGVGMTTSAYLRSRVFGPGPDVAAWRRVYELVVELEAEAERNPVPAERVGQFKAAFEGVALGVFQQEGEG